MRIERKSINFSQVEPHMRKRKRESGIEREIETPSATYCDEIMQMNISLIFPFFYPPLFSFPFQAEGRKKVERQKKKKMMMMCNCPLVRMCV